MKYISILGSTGSIGTQALEVVGENRDKLRVLGLTANKNIDLLEKQINKFSPKIVAVMNKDKALELKKRVGHRVEVLGGMDGLIAISTIYDIDIVLTAVSGMVGLKPTLAAIENGKNIALANKETLVAGGHLVMSRAREKNIKIYPIDSEHSAIFQCLMGNSLKQVERIILTASGGPFRGKTKDYLEKVSIEDALKHPNWLMGKKVTIDSASLMNKGLEVIEAKWLFNLDVDQISVAVHPQSIVHSMVEYQDHSVIAQLGYPDMKIPIQLALFYSDRIRNNLRKFDVTKIGALTFEDPDINNFPCLKLAYDALKIGGSMPTVLNAANEVSVELFLRKKIGFMDIPKINESIMNKHSVIYDLNIHKIIEIDEWARQIAREI